MHGQSFGQVVDFPISYRADAGACPSLMMPRMMRLPEPPFPPNAATSDNRPLARRTGILQRPQVNTAPQRSDSGR